MNQAFECDNSPGCFVSYNDHELSLQCLFNILFLLRGVTSPLGQSNLFSQICSLNTSTDFILELSLPIDYFCSHSSLGWSAQQNLIGKKSSGIGGLGFYLTPAKEKGLLSRPLPVPHSFQTSPSSRQDLQKILK